MFIPARLLNKYTDGAAVGGSKYAAAASKVAGAPLGSCRFVSMDGPSSISPGGAPGTRVRSWGSGFGIQRSGFRGWGSGFGIQSSGFRVWDSAFSVQHLGFRGWGSGFGIQRSGFRVWGLGLRVWALGFRV